MSRVSLIPLGGANSIGASCYVLKFPGYTVAVDRGAGVRNQPLEPLVQEDVQGIIVTHGHRDHGGTLPLAQKHWPGVRMWATFETIQLLQWVWRDEIFIASQEHRPFPFTDEDVAVTLRRVRRLNIGQPIALADDLTVTPFPAGHILGAVGLDFNYRGAHYVVTGDTCLRDHTFIPGAQLPDIGPCEAVVRESTYVGQYPTAERDQVKAELVAYVSEVLRGGGRVIIPALSIDRLPEVYATLHEAGIDRQWPLFVAGGTTPMEVYRDYAPGAHQVLKSVRRFEGRQHQEDTLKSEAPVVVLASSGMVAYGTPSYAWTKGVLGDTDSAICFVNWQDPCSPGGLVLATGEGPGEGQEIALPDGNRKRLCQVRRFDLSTHAKEDEMEGLEESLNPRLVVHVHGEDERIQAYINAKSGTGPQRIKAEVGREIPL